MNGGILMSEFKFGVCTSYKDQNRIMQAKTAGADYIEIGFCDFSNGSEEQTGSFIDFMKSEKLSSPVSNGMFPGELRLVGPDVDYIKIDEFLDKAGMMFSKVGGSTVVFGSSGARRCPEGWKEERAIEQLVELCANHISPYFKKHGLICAIEPLCKKECNIITTAKRGFEICKLADKEEIRLLIDMYHFDTEKEPLESILNYRGYLRHIHIANAQNERKYPKFNDNTDYKAFLNMLREINYEGLISLEGRCDDFVTEVKEGFDVLKNI